MKKSILLIEASPVIRSVIGFLLESEDFIVDIATNGVEGLEKIHSNPYYFVIMSSDLPRIHGYELIQEIRKLEHCKNLPILLITKGETVEQDKKFRRDDLLYLSELKEPEDLIRQIRRVLFKNYG